MYYDEDIDPKNLHTYFQAVQLLLKKKKEEFLEKFNKNIPSWLLKIIGKVVKAETLIDKVEEGENNMCEMINEMIAEAKEAAVKENMSMIDEMIAEAKEAAVKENMSMIDEMIAEAKEAAIKEKMSMIDEMIAEAKEKAKLEARKENMTVLEEMITERNQKDCRIIKHLIELGQTKSQILALNFSEELYEKACKYA